MSVKKEVIIKIFSLFSVIGVIVLFLLIRMSTQIYGETNDKTSPVNMKGKISYQVPYKNTLDLNLGIVQEPNVELPLKTASGFVDTSFLLDTGAIISTLPLRMAKNLGIDIVNARRITLQGFSGVPVFAYLGKITIKIGNQEFEFPATFTEFSKKNILGRKGLLDNFDINFDYEKKIITLSRKANL
ncbi:MAG: retroviral-like aspartic protease family protein [Patescibacteria group bacterium]